MITTSRRTIALGVSLFTLASIAAYVWATRGDQPTPPRMTNNGIGTINVHEGAQKPKPVMLASVPASDPIDQQQAKDSRKKPDGPKAGEKIVRPHAGPKQNKNTRMPRA